jgi:hypothetical protein
MSTFAERYGYRPIRDSIQRESMDGPLRNALWDAFNSAVLSHTNSFKLTKNQDAELVKLMSRLWNGFFKQPTDTIPDGWSTCVEELRNYFMTCAWYDAYSFLEFVVQNSSYGATLKKLAGTFMKREMSAYRFVNDEIVEITNEVEIAAIESATTSSARSVATHLSSALALLSDRQSPDYRNSVKESISAVEAAAQILTGDKSATLGKALKSLPQPLHPAFEAGLTKLYGYTSDANGVRHALSADSTIDAAEARFMLIACSAFVNLLRERSNAALQ